MGWTLHLLPSLTVAERVGHFAAMLGIARAPPRSPWGGARSSAQLNVLGG